MRHVPARAMAALAFAASIWSELKQAGDSLVEIAVHAFGHATREVQQKAILRPEGFVDLTVDGRMVRQMELAVGREGIELGRFQALMLATLAIEDLYQLCVLKAEEVAGRTRCALTFITDRASCTALVRRHGGFSSRGGSS